MKYYQAKQFKELVAISLDNLDQHDLNQPDVRTSTGDIIIFNRDLYSETQITPEPISIRILNLVARMRLVIVEDIQDLIQLIIGYFENQDLAVISIYGAFELDLTGQSLNYLCYMLRKLDENGVVVSLSDEGDVLKRHISNQEERGDIPVSLIIHKWLEIV